MIGRRPSEKTCAAHRANSLRRRRASCVISMRQSFNAFIPPTDPGVGRPTPELSPSALVLVAMGGGVLGVGDEGPNPPTDSRSPNVNWQAIDIVLGWSRSSTGPGVSSNAVGAA